ncbi:MAG: hypothetical protein ACTSU5_19450 [Promethearchaeota archaeon]
MRRFASIDFLRGLAIFLMIFLHVIMFTLDYSIVDSINTLPLINIVAFVVLPFMGGLAGFFLLVSAMGNMVSMQRFLQAGKPVKDLAVRQVMGGVLLLVFAVLTEAWIGYHGALGDAIRLNPNAAETIYWRGHHMETIHTIAWCIILNGIVQAILSREGRWKDTKNVVKVYVLLAVVVVALTVPMWMLASAIVPGYPYATYASMGLANSDRIVQYPLEGVTNFWQYIGLFFLAAVAGHPEPVFPYLAISFVGSIIGIYMSKEREEVPRDFPRNMIGIGFAMFIVGVVGSLVTLVAVMNVHGMDQMLTTYLRIWDHRAYAPDGPGKTWWFGWLFQFLALNGAGICMSMLVIRLVEFRGKGEQFAEKTKFVRRFGFVAFTVYNYQFLYFFPIMQLNLALGREPYALFSWSGILPLVAISLLLIHGVLVLWEKVKYVGSLEWCIGTLAAVLIPARKVKAEGGEKPKWWQLGQLDVEGAFYKPEWLNIVEASEVEHDQLKESKLSWKLSLAGLLTLVPLLGICMIPVAFIAFRIARDSATTEKENSFNRRAKILTLVELAVGTLWLVMGFTLSLSSLGVSL